MRDMSFTSRDTARATDILMMMVGEKECTNILTIAGSTSVPDVCRFTWIWFVTKWLTWLFPPVRLSSIWTCSRLLATNTTKGHQDVPDMQLRELYIDRIYDTFIDEEEFIQACDHTTFEIAKAWNHVLILHVNLSGKSVNGYTEGHAVKKDSLIQTC